MSERQASTFRRGSYTDPHLRVLQILNENNVSYKSECVLDLFDFDGLGRPVSAKVDVLIQDIKYGFGVIEVDGEAHRKHWLDDARRDRRLKKLHLWVLHIPNAEVERTMEYLATAKIAEEFDFP